jgi:crossover junction endodeoxyribonuclease RuvC
MTEKSQRVFGVDPGSRKTGFGIIDINNNKPLYVTSGVIKSLKGDFTERLETIFKSVSSLMDEYRPKIIVIESVFVHKNAGSALKLGHARAAALCASFDRGIEVFEYAPREIKKAIVGNGAATKEQVQHMVTAILDLSVKPSEDAADAIAAALCYSNQRNLTNSLKKIKVSGR